MLHRGGQRSGSVGDRLTEPDRRRIDGDEQVGAVVRLAGVTHELADANTELSAGQHAR